MPYDISTTRADLIIHGERVPARSGRSFETVNPATEQPLAQVAEAGVEDVNDAVASARKALTGDWGRMRAADRGQILLRFADLIRRDQDELIELESLDSGKPVSTIRRQDMPAVLDTLTYYAGFADKINGQVIPARQDALTYTVREPVGVVGAIVPWNFPMMIGMWKIAPALACGCTVVLKPAELTPLTALKLGELALEAGLPAGVLNVVPGFGAIAGQALVDHPDVDKVTFTGSPGVGRQILQGSAGNLKRVTLELGGKSANVIFPDADIETAAKAAASGIFFNSGQVCSAGSRIVVHNSIREEVVERLVARAEKIRTGDPSDGGTQMGPVVSEKQMDRILDYIRIGEEEGARLVTGGARAMERGYFVAPTVFDDVRPEMRISQEEIFGPVASVIGFEDEDEALAIANGTSFSLAAGIWTNDMRRMHRFLRDLKAGTVWANTFGPTDVRLPWGGTRDSGFGREHGEIALENFTEPKSIWIAHGA
ncbi:NAD/NADP-dependent betaine aldehyde dehydrogenase [Roseovarius sp. THAF27]|uniref:aldehyde dehydrogenase family protein n=1 Tax=unclassified Roseovarius TaxID=2614913 RepID=UPI0012690F15|nr:MULTISPECIES: aldehyde dehydrogenase family protein [unclassified Roseovarius]QFT81351.1 NAD/NADP-dependent betaine aldehyde dehydrogenase [Roseovarius sp. THAF27]QFT99513.1 NAD/NADP-dependent betaine aldehyde dehydrogenase [Roseovarius sp. THAF8]